MAARGSAVVSFPGEMGHTCNCRRAVGWGGGLVGAGSCGCIYMCCSDEMLNEIVIASVFSRQIGGRVTVGRDNSLSLYIFF